MPCSSNSCEKLLWAIDSFIMGYHEIQTNELHTNENILINSLEDKYRIFFFLWTSYFYDIFKIA